MKVSEIIDKLGLQVYAGSEGLEKEIKGGYVSDLLSDVMGNSKEGDVWITLQTHNNVSAIASLKEHAAVILVKGLAPEEKQCSIVTKKKFHCWVLFWSLLRLQEDYTYCFKSENYQGRFAHTFCSVSLW